MLPAWNPSILISDLLCPELCVYPAWVSRGALGSDQRHSLPSCPSPHCWVASPSLYPEALGPGTKPSCCLSFSSTSTTHHCMISNWASPGISPAHTLGDVVIIRGSWLSFLSWVTCSERNVFPPPGSERWVPALGPLSMVCIGPGLEAMHAVLWFGTGAFPYF